MKTYRNFIINNKKPPVPRGGYSIYFLFLTILYLLYALKTIAKQKNRKVYFLY